MNNQQVQSATKYQPFTTHQNLFPIQTKQKSKKNILEKIKAPKFTDIFKMNLKLNTIF